MADSSGKIYITISDETGNGSGGSGNGGSGGGGGTSPNYPRPKLNPQTPNTSKNQNLAMLIWHSYIGHKTINLAVQTAKDWVNFGISHIGDFTGNYIGQKNVQGAVNLAFQSVGTFNSIMTGAVVAGPAGMVVGGLTHLIRLGSNIVQSGINDQIETAKKNQEIALLRERAGLDSSTNGGRYGD